MKKIILALGVSTMFLAGGCDDGSGKLKEIKNKMCECKDIACVTAVSSELAGLETDGNKKLLEEIAGCVASAAAGGMAPAE